MNAARIALIPIAHVAAEVVACPFASEAGLSLSLATLCPRLSKESEHLWRAAEQDLLHAHPAVALDELVAIRDDIWFHNAKEERPLGKYLQATARRFFEVRGGRAFPRPGLSLAGPSRIEGDGTARVFLRWLSFALPMDLFLAALGEGDRFPVEVQAISPLLEQSLFDSGFAEVHTHLNGCFDFANIWVSTLRGLARPDLKEEAFQSPGASLREGKDLAGWLLRAAIARYILAAYLEQRGRGCELRAFLADAIERKVTPGMGPGASATLVQALDDLLKGRLSPALFEAVHALYSRMIDTRSGPLPQEVEEIWSWDPIAPLMDRIDGPPEVFFVARGLRYLEQSKGDELFARLFWQTVRVRCLLYRHLVQRPMTPGLPWFVRFFKRIKETRSLLKTQVKAQIASKLCGANQGLRSLEVRSAPEKDVSETFNEIVDFDEALRRCGHTRDEAPFEFGIVWHFGRDRKGRWLEGMPAAHWAGTAADPTLPDSRVKQDNLTGYRYGTFYRAKRQEAVAAAHVLTLFPRSLEIVRGVDLCTDEAGVPTWVMTPLVRYVVDAGKEASFALREHLGMNIPPLRVSVHAGEDFVHLLSGLRRLDEAIEYLGLSEGHRLGHALSLGVDAQMWAERAGRVAIPREERLLDLAWEWTWYARSGRGAAVDRHLLLQKEIAEHSKKIFEQELTPWQVEELVRDLHDEQVLRALGFPDGPYPTGDLGKRWNLVLDYLTSPSVFQRGREILWIDPADEAEAIELLQRKLREKVGRIGLVIEVNPSSNLLIGHLGDIGHHPLWNLSPPVAEGDVPPLSVCIGSDDPLTFATTLREEYQLLYDALVQEGNAEVASSWLERARSAGLKARFTLPQSRELRGEAWPGQRDPRREALMFSPLGWNAKLDLPP